MKLRDEHPQETDAPVRPEAGDGEGDEQRARRDRSAALLAAADEAISRALSRDSAEFLMQNRQAGGQ